MQSTAAANRSRELHQQISERRALAMPWARDFYETLRADYCPVWFERHREENVRAYADAKARQSIQLGQSLEAFAAEVNPPVGPVAIMALEMAA